MIHDYLRYTTITTLVLTFFSLIIQLNNAQAFDFAKDYSISDATPSFMAGYSRAHYHVFFNSSYNERDRIPQNNTYYDSQTGIKLEGQNARSDYIHGYWLGWKDAQDGKYHIDC
jgi:hypothetical protein